MSGTIRVLDPRADVRAIADRPLPTLPDLRGRRAAILNNGWQSMDKMTELMTDLLKSRYGVAEVEQVRVQISMPADPAMLDALPAKADFAIVGLAN